MKPEEYRALAESATQGPWKVDDREPGDVLIPVGSGRVHECYRPADARYIAAHDPSVTTLLWDVVHAAEHGPDGAITTALNALYAHIGYEP